MKDLMNNIHPVPAIIPALNTNSSAAIVSAIIDRLGFESLTFVIITGALTDADATFAVLVEDGAAANLSDAAAVADEQLIGTEALAGFAFGDDTECRKIGYSGYKRYVRLTITPTGNGAGDAPIAAIALLGHGHATPEINPPA
jgi:hypothetical protein